MISTELLVAVSIVVASFSLFVCNSIMSTRQDLKEPPQASTSIPIVGHVLGIMRSKFNYYVQLSQKVPHDIFTMNMPGQKMYIVTTSEMIQAIQKQPKVFAFPPIQAKFSRAVCGVSDQAHETYMKNVNGDEGDWGLSMEAYVAMREALKPGPGVDAMNRIMIENLDSCLDELKTSEGKSTRIGLAKWLRYSVTLATTNSVYGPMNPFKEDGITEAFWDFEADLMPILIGFFPSWTASKGLASRKKVAEAFKRYFEARGQEQSSDFVKKRYDTSVRNHVPMDDIARYEVGGSIAVLVNTVPAVFWMLFLVFSYPQLLADIRSEIEALVEEKEDPDGTTNRSVDVTDLKQSCPLLISTLQETLRFRSMGTSVRQVMKDSTLQDKWLLKKDTMIQMPSRVVHVDENVWGPTAGDFEPRRFMKDSNLRPAGGKRPSPSAFRAFGGGSTLCPGRHFATNEILVVVVMFALRFDIRPVNDEWTMPTADKTNFAAVIMEPDTDVEVEVTQRKGFEQGTWTFKLKDSEKIFAMVAEDKDEHD